MSEVVSQIMMKNLPNFHSQHMHSIGELLAVLQKLDIIVDYEVGVDIKYYLLEVLL